MVNSYTFSRNHQGANMFYCSRRLAAKCKARVKVKPDGAVLGTNLTHNHAPPNYIWVGNKYYKVGE